MKRRREDMCESERIKFDGWINDIKTKLAEIREKKAARAQRRAQLAKRRTAASQERMRIISQLARNNKVGCYHGFLTISVSLSLFLSL